MCEASTGFDDSRIKFTTELMRQQEVLRYHELM